MQWPAQLDAFLSPARGKLDQYELWSRDRDAINRALPLISDNPYVITSSPIPWYRNKGMQVVCSFNKKTVIAQFHRKLDSKGIWIGSNYTIEGKAAALQWSSFLINFGVQFNNLNLRIPIILEFHKNLKIFIRLNGSPIVDPSYTDGI
jgi:hypothetical protein